MKIVAVSASVLPGEREEILWAGFDDFSVRISGVSPALANAFLKSHPQLAAFWRSTPRNLRSRRCCADCKRTARAL